MATVFDVVTEEFIDDMDAIRALVTTFSDPAKGAKARLAAANSATLLVAATFEEFIREMAREYARAVVQNAESFDKLPSKLAATAWRRTMDGLARLRVENGQGANAAHNILGKAQARFSVIYSFCTGDMTQDIYRDLIHNENNMRPAELNNQFKVSGLGDVCKKLSDKQPNLEFFGAFDANSVHGKIISSLEDFFERRNAIAHALNRGQSSGPDQIMNEIGLLENFGKSLCETLNQLLPSPPSITVDGGDVSLDAV